MNYDVGIRDDQDAINVPLLAGLLSGVGTLFLALLCAILWFAISGDGSIRLGGSDAGAFDDDAAFLEDEIEALEHMDEASREEYLQAKAWIEANPPNSANTDISLSQFMTIQEKGVSAWEFEIDFATADCFVERRTDLEFFDSVCSIQTNLPIPRQNEVYYWEAKIYEKAENTIVSVGLATKPYPGFRLPGFHRYSVAYDTTGARRINRPFDAPVVGPKCQQGDIIGVGYRPRSGTVFFTRNGRKLDDALHGMRMNLFPIIGATGPCMISVNFGQLGFVFVEANAKKWGLAPAQGSLAPPPPYGVVKDSVLIESSTAIEAADGDADESQPLLDSVEDAGPSSQSAEYAITRVDSNLDASAGGEQNGSISLNQLSSVVHPTTRPPQKKTGQRHSHLNCESPPPSYTSDSESTGENGSSTANGGTANEG